MIHTVLFTSEAPVILKHLGLLGNLILQSSEHQQGFRKKHYNASVPRAKKGSTQGSPYSTVIVELDMSTALDLRFVSSLPVHMKRWVANYLQARQTYDVFRGTHSKFKKVKHKVEFY